MKLITVPLVVFALSAVAVAQTGFRDNTERNLRCDDHNEDSSHSRACEIREQALASTGSLNVNGGENGGVTVKGWSQPGLLVRSKIEAWSDSPSDSKTLLSAVQIHTESGTVSANGPKSESDRGWSVSYEVFVPHQTSLELEANNGGLHVEDVGGTMNLRTVNGGLHLARLTGAVTGVTVNGGLHVDLMGDHWDGRGLDATSTNGGVHVAIPQSYSAQFEVNTVNGGIHSDFPELSVSGHEGRSRPQSIVASLGRGGATIHVATTNGGLTIARQ